MKTLRPFYYGHREAAASTCFAVALLSPNSGNDHSRLAPWCRCPKLPPILQAESLIRTDVCACRMRLSTQTIEEGRPLQWAPPTSRKQLPAAVPKPRLFLGYAVDSQNRPHAHLSPVNPALDPRNGWNQTAGWNRRLGTVLRILLRVLPPVRHPKGGGGDGRLFTEVSDNIVTIGIASLPLRSRRCPQAIGRRYDDNRPERWRPSSDGRPMPFPCVNVVALVRLAHCSAPCAGAGCRAAERSSPSSAKGSGKGSSGRGSPGSQPSPTAN